MCAFLNILTMYVIKFDISNNWNIWVTILHCIQIIPKILIIISIYFQKRMAFS